MDIKKSLPSGSSFHTTGAGSFAKKLSSATLYGRFKNLRDNQSSIIKAAGSYASAIRRGSFGRLKQRGFIGKVRQMESAAGHTLTRDDKKDLKEIMKYLGSRAEATKTEEEKPSENQRTAEILEKKMSEREAVKSGQRPGHPVTNRALAKDNIGLGHHFSPYDRLHRSGRERLAPVSPSQAEPDHGSGLASNPASHGTGVSNSTAIIHDNKESGHDAAPPSPPISLVS